MGLTDSQQGALVLVSMILIVIGGVSVPLGVNLYVGLVLAIIGAIGMAIKEWLGTSSPVKPQSVS